VCASTLTKSNSHNPTLGLRASLTRSIHGCQVAGVHNKFHVSNGLLQAIHAALFQQLPHYLVGNLVAPLIDGRHGDVINENTHGLATRGPVRPAPTSQRAY